MEKRKNQGQEWEDEEVIDLGEIFYALLRKLWVIIAVAVLGAGIGGAYSYFLLTPQYSSTAKIYVLTKETTLTSLADLQIGTQLTQDYKTIITGRSVMEEWLISFIWIWIIKNWSEKLRWRTRRILVF